MTTGAHSGDVRRAVEYEVWTQLSINGGAFDNLGNFVLPAGTTISAITTVTAYADPANFETFDITLDPTLLSSIAFRRLRKIA
jgi:hypothetical protein